MNITYKEAKQRSLKKRDIWVRRLVCDPITTPLAYFFARFTKVSPMQVTIATFILGMGAALSFLYGYLIEGAVLYLLFFLSDGLDGKLNRVLGRDDTYRGIIDFTLDGIVCIAVVLSIGIQALLLDEVILLWLLLTWMSIHYMDMRLTSASYRLKVQFGSRDVWLVSEGLLDITPNKIIRIYYRLLLSLEKLRTYPHPTVGEAVILMFVVGPILWSLTRNIDWMLWVTVLGILFIIPETIGAGLIAYILAKGKEKE